MKKFYWIIFILIFSFFISNSLCFSQEKKKLSLKDCIEVALKNNSQLRNGEMDVQLANADIATARSFILPDISSTFYTGRSIDGDQTRIGRVQLEDSLGAKYFVQQEYLIKGSERNDYYFRVQLTQNIWDWGRSFYSIRQAKLGKKSAKLSLLSLQNTVIYDVKQRYFELLKAIKLGEVYEEAVKRSEEQLKRTEIMHQIGSVALADVYKARVTLGNDQINLITQKNLIIEAEANLNHALGLDPESSIRIEEGEEIFSTTKYTLEDALKISSEKNPELKKYELKIQNHKYEKRKANLAFLPTINGSASYSRYNELFDRVYKGLNQNYSVSVGAQIDLNIFKGFADKTEVQRQSLNYSKAQEDYYERKRVLKAQVIQAYLSLKAYKEISEINDTNLVSAEEDLRLAQESYKIGAGTLLELIDAQLAVTQARSTLVRAKYNTQIALAYLESLMSELEEE
jgi:outer membrane protein